MNKKNVSFKKLIDDYDSINRLLVVPKIMQKAPSVPLFVISAGHSFLILEKHLDVSYSGFIFKIENEIGEMCYLKDDFPVIFDSMQKKLKQDKKFFAKMKKTYEKDFLDAQKKYSSYGKKGFKNLSEKELFEAFKESVELMMLSVGIAHMIEPFSILGGHRLKDLLSQKIKDPKDLNEALNVLTTPKTKSFSNQYDDALHKIRAESDAVKKTILIRKTLKRFGWIKNSYAGPSRLTPNDINEEIKTLKKQDKNYFKKIETEKKRIHKKYGLDKETSQLAQRLIDATIWQDERKINILKSINSLNVVLEEIAKRYHADIKKLYYLLDDEILAKKFLEPCFDDEIKKRLDYSLCFFDKEKKNQLTFYSGKKARKVYQKVVFEEQEFGDTINGFCASTGNAVGEASVCLTLNDIRNFKEGDVLVTSMTRPEFLPAMKKCVAIVADEGGITSHAAIVSRELGKPCVIGTKNATKIIKTGDLIEVKANHGAVRILERKKIR